MFVIAFVVSAAIHCAGDYMLTYNRLHNGWLLKRRRRSQTSSRFPRKTWRQIQSFGKCTDHTQRTTGIPVNDAMKLLKEDLAPGVKIDAMIFYIGYIRDGHPGA